MKTAIIFLAAIFVSMSVFAQNSLEIVKNLNESRQAELEMLNERADEISSPSKKEKFVKKETKSINQRYDRLISQALRNEKPEKEEQSNHRRIAGANVQIEGHGGNFSGKTSNINKGASAYATVRQADANAYFTEKYADNLGSQFSASSGAGVKVVISNEYRYKDIQVVVKNRLTGQEKAVFVRRNGKTNVNLLPGDYSYIASSNDGTQASNSKNFNLSLTNHYEFDGEKVGYYIVVGSR